MEQEQRGGRRGKEKTKKKSRKFMRVDLSTEE